MDLTKQQQAFVDAYLCDPELNGAECVRKAGYKTKYPGKLAYQLLENTRIKAVIQAARDKRAKRTEITQDRVLQEYARLSFFDPRKLFNADGSPIPINELDDDTAAAIGGLEVLEQWEGTGQDRKFVGYVKKYKIVDKKGALDSVGKHLGMFIEKHEHTGKDGVPLQVVFNIPRPPKGTTS